MVDHHLDGVVARERAVLDAVDARADARPDTGVAVGVGRDFQTRTMRLVGDGRELLVGVLLRAREPAVRHHATRRRDLDDARAVLDLVAHRLAHLGHAVRDPLFDTERHDAGPEPLEHGRVEVAAGGRDRMPGGHEAWTVDPTIVDRARERDVEEVAAGLDEEAEVARGREAREQRGPAGERPPQCAERGIVLHVAARVPTTGPAQEHVQLHVHETRQQRDVAEIDLGRVARQLGRIHRRDAFTLDDDHRRRSHYPRVDVDPPIRPQDEG